MTRVSISRKNDSLISLSLEKREFSVLFLVSIFKMLRKKILFLVSIYEIFQTIFFLFLIFKIFWEKFSYLSRFMRFWSKILFLFLNFQDFEGKISSSTRLMRFLKRFSSWFSRFHFISFENTLEKSQTNAASVCSDPSPLSQHLKMHSGESSNKCNQCAHYGEVLIRNWK